MKKIISIVIILFFLIVSFHLKRNQTIAYYWWKHCDGFGIVNDVGVFDINSINIFDRKLYSNGKPVAILKNYWFLFDHHAITIKSLDNSKFGTYCSKGKRTTPNNKSQKIIHKVQNLNIYRLYHKQ